MNVASLLSNNTISTLCQSHCHVHSRRLVRLLQALPMNSSFETFEAKRNVMGFQHAINARPRSEVLYSSKSRNVEHAWTSRGIEATFMEGGDVRVAFSRTLLCTSGTFALHSLQAILLACSSCTRSFHLTTLVFSLSSLVFHPWFSIRSKYPLFCPFFVFSGGVRLVHELEARVHEAGAAHTCTACSAGRPRGWNSSPKIDKRCGNDGRSDATENDGRKLMDGMEPRICSTKTSKGGEKKKKLQQLEIKRDLEVPSENWTS